MNAKQKRITHMTAPQTIMLGFGLMILIGTLLLNLPIASQSGESIGFLDALFTATSANCVTGLVVVNTMEHWTLFGKLVILALIQLGGLGFVAVMTVTMVLIRRHITLRERQAIQASFNQDGIGGMVRLVRQVLTYTIIIEGLGALALAIAFYQSRTMTALEAIYQGVFHAISAFCNAGFDNIGTMSMIPYRDHLPINLILMVLIILGGLGFTVLAELKQSIRNPKKRSPRLRLIHLSLQAKLVLITSLVLTLGGALIFLLLEWSNPNTLATLTMGQKQLAVLFQSVTLRTAGFNTLAQDGLTPMSKAISCLFMLIGGSPAGTAGGMKTVTIAVIFVSMLSGLRGRNKLEAFGRTLPFDLLQKALTVVTAMLAVVFISTFVLYFSEQANPYPHTLLDLLFETSSAAGTVGISTGITPHLSRVGRVTIIICMYLGRLSPITVVMALNAILHKHTDGLSYPSERVIIG